MTEISTTIGFKGITRQMIKEWEFQDILGQRTTNFIRFVFTRAAEVRDEKVNCSQFTPGPAISRKSCLEAHLTHIRESAREEQSIHSSDLENMTSQCGSKSCAPEDQAGMREET